MGPSTASGALKGEGPPQKGGTQTKKMRAPKGGTPKGPKFHVFFPLQLPLSLFLSLTGGLLVEFGGVFEGRDPQMCTFGALGLSRKMPADLLLIFGSHLATIECHALGLSQSPLVTTLVSAAPVVQWTKRW